MRKLAGGILALGLTFGATACGKVDKAGTADSLIKNLEKSGQTLTDAEKVCITDAIKSYSDDDLKKLAKLNQADIAASALAQDYITKVSGCVTAGSASTDAPTTT